MPLITWLLVQSVSAQINLTGVVTTAKPIHNGDFVNATGTGSFQITVVPEPASVSLIILACLFLVAFKLVRDIRRET